MLFDIVIWFGIANGQTSSIFDWVICLPHDSGVLCSRFYFNHDIIPNFSGSVMNFI